MPVVLSTEETGIFYLSRLRGKRNGGGLRGYQEVMGRG